MYRSSDRDETLGENPMKTGTTMIGSLDPKRSKIISQKVVLLSDPPPPPLSPYLMDFIAVVGA